jgi:ABC-type multidrug transport system fused ATPase/permease subunit
MAISFATLIITTATSLVLPAAVGHILDISLAPTTDSYTPTTIAVGLFGMFAVQSVFIGLRTGLLAVAGERIATRIRR